MVKEVEEIPEESSHGQWETLKPFSLLMTKMIRFKEGFSFGLECQRSSWSAIIIILIDNNLLIIYLMRKIQYALRLANLFNDLPTSPG